MAGWLRVKHIQTIHFFIMPDDVLINLKLFILLLTDFDYRILKQSKNNFH